MKSYITRLIVNGETEIERPFCHWIEAEAKMIDLVQIGKKRNVVTISEEQNGTEKEVVRVSVKEPIQSGNALDFHLFLRNEYIKAKNTVEELRKEERRDQGALVRHIDLLDRYELIKHMMRQFEKRVEHNLPEI